MTGEHRRENIAHELERADAALAEASLLFAHGLYVGAISRAYYHAFHAAAALLLTEGLQSKTHSGLAHMVSLHFVRTGLLDARTARFLGELEAERTAADYDTAAVFTKEMAEEKLERARLFGEAARELIGRSGCL